jgi:collagenase-like PrtC family protease
MIQFSVATNFDDELLRQVQAYPVTEVFGKLPRDVVGGGRPAYVLGRVTRRRLRDHVRLARSLGIGFNYLLNAACLDNREFTPRGRREIERTLAWLAECGVTSVTVSIPYLLEFVKRRLPEVQVKVGVFARVATVQQAKFWEALGADCITLDPLIINRDFKALAAIRAAVRCDLQLIPNSDCLLHCPLAGYHMVTLSHASQRRHLPGSLPPDYCFLACTAAKLVDPVHYIRSNWIRPEDLGLYAELGYTRFKLLERGAPTEVMVRRVRAYATGRFDGNLLDLIDPLAARRLVDLERAVVGSAGSPVETVRWFLRGWRGTRARLRQLARLRLELSDARRPGVFVDNRKLDGFLKGFPTAPCAARDCQLCGYCRDWAAQAVTVAGDFERRYLEAALPLREALLGGTGWRS